FLFERLVFGSIERATVMRWGMVRTAKGEDSYDRPITTGLWEYGSPLSRGRQLGETHETLLLGYSRRPCHRRELVDRRRPGLSRSPGDDHRAVRARRLRRYRRPPLRAKTVGTGSEAGRDREPPRRRNGGRRCGRREGCARRTHAVAGRQFGARLQCRAS